MPVEVTVVADDTLPMLLTIITMVWTIFGCWVGYQTAMMKHKTVMKEIEKRDELLDHYHTAALESKNETIKVLRGMLYALSDESNSTG